MLLIPLSVGHRAKLETPSSLAILSLLLLLLLHCCQAGVIKKRDTLISTVTETGNSVSDSQAKGEQISILTAPSNVSDVVTTKLQSVAGTTFPTETSKELSNNEILLNEAKKLLEEEDKIVKGNSETSESKEREEEEDKALNSGEQNETTKTISNENVQDIKEIIKQLEFKQPILSGTTQSSVDVSENENASSLENSLKAHDMKPRPPSRILPELRTEQPTKRPIIVVERATTTAPNPPQGNSIEHIQEQNENKTAVQIQIMPLETISTSTPYKDPEFSDNNLKSHSNAPTETSLSVARVTESLEVMEATTVKPIKEEMEVKPNQKLVTNNIQDGLDREELVKTNEIKYMTITTTPEPLGTPKDMTEKPFIKEEEDDKKQYSRSMFSDEITTLASSQNANEVFLPITTYRPVIVSIKQGVEDTSANPTKSIYMEPVTTTSNAKEKKPKFINDNSTNAQQLNLPNNAEVWSLAAMKSLPKDIVGIETAQTPNHTTGEFRENVLNNHTLTLSSNNEKNLLDWSHIMGDKELSTTTRNEDYQQQTELQTEKEQQENQLSNEDNKTPQLSVVKDKIEPREEPTMTTENVQLSTSTTDAILSNVNSETDNKETDKIVEENTNNQKTAVMDTLDEATSTTATTLVDNNPFNNTTSNIEPNLSEINLTSKRNQNPNDSNNSSSSNKNEQMAIVTAGKLNDDVNADVQTLTNVATTTTTEATAVVDMTTTAVEQISSETTTFSTLETTKQNASLNNVVVSESQIEHEHQQNSTHRTVNIKESSLSAVLTGTSKNLYETSTTTVVPITTFRPIILAITSTTSKPATFQQEVDENGNETQTNLTNNNAEQQQKQSIIINKEADDDYDNNNNNKIGHLHDNNNSTKTVETHLSEREFDTTTHEPVTATTTTATETETETETTELAASKIKYPLTSSVENNTTTTSSSKDNLLNETTTEIILEFEETTTTTTTTSQTTPKKQVDETTIGSPVLTDKKLESQEFEAAATTTTTETIETSKKPPVAIDTKQQQQGTAFNESVTPTTTTTTSATATTEQNIIATTSEKQESEIQTYTSKADDANIETTTRTTIMSSTTTTETMPVLVTSTKTEETYISLLDDTTTTTTPSYSPAISPPLLITTTTTTSSPSLTSSTVSSAITTKVEEIYNVIHSTTTELIQSTTTSSSELQTESGDSSSTSSTNSSNSNNTFYPDTTPSAFNTPSTQILETADIGNSLPTLTSIMGGNSGNMYPKNSEASGETDVNVIIAITVSVIGVVALILLVGFLYIMRKRQKQNSYPNRCRPVSMDEFTIDNASVGGSMRKSSALRSSKRTYGNLAFDDPSLRHNPMGSHELTKFVQDKLRIFEEFRDVPQITARLDEVPAGCEDKNRYANVLPLPETRVILQRLDDDEKTEYINANYVTGPKDPPNYYIACQAPLDSTVEDFWRMIWEQQSRVIIQATDLIENGVEKCAEYLPPSVTLDNHSSFGDFQIILQNREVKDKYAISTLQLKNVRENASRELTHYWYKWPEMGVPAEEAPIIAMLLEARSSLLSYAIEQANEEKDKTSTMASLKSAEEGTAPAMNNSNGGNSANGSTGEINGNISMVHIKKTARNQGPLTIHCSPGTGRTGTIIACDIAIRSLETPKRTVDIPQIVYHVRRGRASAVLTKEQYEFIYKVATMYAAKITNPTNYN